MKLNAIFCMVVITLQLFIITFSENETWATSVNWMSIKSPTLNLGNSSTFETREQLRNDDLIAFLLAKTNDARLHLNLSSLKLSSNRAAQVHAEELFKVKSNVPSHISVDGMKPFMTYSLYGGTGYPEQNVAISGYDSKLIIHCKVIGCKKLNPFNQISQAHWNMIYNDTECCHDRHRTNILDPHHTHVSIGIAYDDYYFALVENFENNYVKIYEPITKDNRTFSIVGKIEPSENTNYEINSIGIYYNPKPTTSYYEQNKASKSYELGNLSAIIAKPAPLFYQYQKPTEYNLIEANSWLADHQRIEIRFDLSPLVVRQGMYTIVAYLEDTRTDRFPAMSYSFLVK